MHEHQLGFRTHQSSPPEFALTDAIASLSPASSSNFNSPLLDPEVDFKAEVPEVEVR